MLRYLSMRTLVTGANGFVGRHLIRELHGRGHKVVALGHGGKIEPELEELVEDYYECDLTDIGQVSRLPLEGVDAVINLAGLANVGASFSDPEKYKRINVEVLTVIGERLLQIGSKARVVAISTGAVYESDQPLPLTEESQTIAKGSPYALSKLAMEDAAGQLRKKGLSCVVARPFNHAGPGQAPGFLIPDLYKKLTEAEKSGQPVMVGNLKTKRDYTDVRDVVRAYADLASSETLGFGIYNVCSGMSRSGQEILDIFLEKMNLSGKVDIEVDKSLVRPNDPPELYGSHDRLTEETGWEPEIPFEQTIIDFVDPTAER